MLRSCSRCLIVTLFSEQYDSIDLISSKVIISVFIAKVAGQRTCHNMHFFGCLHKNYAKDISIHTDDCCRGSDSIVQQRIG